MARKNFCDVSGTNFIFGSSVTATTIPISMGTESSAALSRYLATLAVVLPITMRFVPAGPGRIGPLIPAVPKYRRLAKSTSRATRATVLPSRWCVSKAWSSVVVAESTSPAIQHSAHCSKDGKHHSELCDDVGQQAANDGLCGFA